jgi:hypothetical protein
LLKLFDQRQQVNVFDWYLKLSIAVIAAAAFGLADMNPVGGFIAGISKTIFGNKSFN